MDLREKQHQYEIDTDVQAAADRLQQLNADAADGKLEIPRTQRFIARAYAEVKQSIEAVLAIQTRGVGGKFKGWLRKVPSDVAAVIAIREVISRLMSSKQAGENVSIQNLATAIGRAYELEVRVHDAEVVNPLYMKRVHEQIKDRNTTSQSHIRGVYNTAYKAVMKEGAECSLSNSEHLQLGKFGVQACMDAGIVQLHKGLGKNGNLYIYTLVPEIQDFLLRYNQSDVANVLNKSTGAMMCPPDPWTTLSDGGYLSARRKAVQPFLTLNNIRKSERPRLRDTFTAEGMPMVFEAANYLQSIPFSIHKPTLDAIKRVWMDGGGVMGVPGKAIPEVPVFPFSETWDKAGAPENELSEFTRWKMQCVMAYDNIREWRGKTREIGSFIRVANDIKGAMWLPVFVDRRGRWYYRGTPNPQGSDMSKAALHSDVKKPLGKAGLYWLKVQIANCFGFDKERFDERAAWTDANWTTIQNALEQPENHPDVWGNDSPWCMFSAAYELNQAYLSGNPETYECGVFVHMDATCSGLQHFSAMLRDPIGGGFTNLYDDTFVGPKQDIYSRVATNALAVIKMDSESSDPEKAAVALWWLKAGIPRGLAKKPVMTYCYGATLRGTLSFVHQYVEEEMGLRFPDGVRAYDYASYAAQKLFIGIAATVPAAEAAMQWLKGVARQMPNGRRMEWKSPTGFLVQHDYQAYDEVRVKLRSCGVTSALVRDYNEDTRPIPMQNAVSPNFVHALDASHVTYTALKMKAQGLHMVGIHDSFGTHPCDVGAMHQNIREAFVDIYQNRNVLAEFLWDVEGTGEVPMRGTLDLSRVLDSEFFFC